MVSLLMAAVFFDGIHLFVAGTGLRGILVRKTGEEVFQGIFSVLSLVGIFWLCRAYGQADYVELWGQVLALRPAALVVMFFAFFFVVLGLSTANPTAVRGGALLMEKEPARGIQRITRHPFLWGVVLWSFTHLVINGDLASLIFFGAFLLLALAGPPSIDWKRKQAFGAAWDGFAAVTSNVPFMAIVEGRNSLKIAELGWWRLLLAVVLYGFFLHMHKTLFGVSPLPA